MRKINTSNFQIATRSTVREVNRQIVLSLIRDHQPISRAELARQMDVHRSVLTQLVGDLVATGAVYEEGTGRISRGRPPTLLYVRTSGRVAVAVDVRQGRTAVAIAEFGGRVIARDAFETPATAPELVDILVTRVRRLVATPSAGHCQGIGIVVPGMVDRRSGRVLYAPRLGWRDVDLREAVSARLNLPVHVESAPIACALARLWSAEETGVDHSFAYVSISDGVGVGLVINGDALRGAAHTAGEFGHVSLDPRGPRCICGKRGCWEAFAGNAATITRYLALSQGTEGRLVADAHTPPRAAPSVEEIIHRARLGDAAAAMTLGEAGEHIGRGLAAIVSAFNPARIYVGGEITGAWELIEARMRQALAEGTLTSVGQHTPIVPDRSPAEYRLLGAVALVAAPSFAAPTVG
jgi:predicted NBD/HSP70 family sugar kinase